MKKPSLQEIEAKFKTFPCWIKKIIRWHIKIRIDESWGEYERINQILDNMPEKDREEFLDYFDKLVEKEDLIRAKQRYGNASWWEWLVFYFNASTHELNVMLEILKGMEKVNMILVRLSKASLVVLLSGLYVYLLLVVISTYLRVSFGPIFFEIGCLFTGLWVMLWLSTATILGMWLLAIYVFEDVPDLIKQIKMYQKKRF